MSIRDSLRPSRLWNVGEAYQQDGQETYAPPETPQPKPIEEVDLVEFEWRPTVKFVVAFAIGALFFLIPVPWQGEVTVPFDIVVSAITSNFPTAAGAYAAALILGGGS